MLDALAADTISASDRHFMAAALRLGREMLGQVWPNPAVGCVIVRDGIIVGQGQTQPGGRPHAERIALDDAGLLARGATAYVTLEPCCHWGKTPPCADAMIRAGIRRVVVALQDPDPRVNGGGIRRLREAGIPVLMGLGARAAAATHAGFFHRVSTEMPRLIVSRRMPRWVDAEISSEGGTPLTLIGDGRRIRPLFISSTHPRFLDPSPAPSTALSARDGMLLLGLLGLTNVVLHPADPIVPTLERGWHAVTHRAAVDSLQRAPTAADDLRRRQSHAAGIWRWRHDHA
jgi:pyrimidine deaminase RibD-like protein